LVRSSYHADGQAHLIARPDIEATWGKAVVAKAVIANEENVISLSALAA
jgi:hypothetical protein